jgi:phosphoribosylaminoimidazole-succinocarboxamide synthase
MGSVKDLTILKQPEGLQEGLGKFSFSDRYSVFDWGQMPDPICNKGVSLCMSGAYFFRKLEAAGFKTHFLGLEENGSVKELQDLSGPSGSMQVRIVRVLKPADGGGAYDYSRYRGEQGNFLIPLEIIYRNSLPAGASIFKRLKKGEIKLEDIGLKENPVPGQKLSSPIADVSTKLEVTDRYVSWDEAKEIAALSDSELELLKETVLEVSRIISREVTELGLENMDGKIELAMDSERKLMIVDVVGTLDECRFSYGDMAVSKEIARIYYRTTDWYSKLEEAKKADRMNWKNGLESPARLPGELAELISDVYCGYCNGITGRQWFDIRPLQDTISRAKEILEV